ncbi:MAG: malonyl CoA-acyl carrier protein transacylase [Rhodobacterales bacterium]|nr:MAG: malonyl CoA-acyl carrier protein transacylase [Rhodobacterales bacterium]
MLSLVFPGQGSQYIGMGKDFSHNFPIANEVYNEVDDVLGFSLSKLIFNGQIEDLTLTKNAQPAIMATSIAILKTLEKEGFKIKKSKFVAGHSLGEYTALCASGAISLADTAHILKMRGIFMQEAVSVGVGAMAAILGLNLDNVETLVAEIKDNEICEIANDNEPNQVVLSGHRTAIEKACVKAKSLGAKRAILLPVSAPFHCSLMAPAQENMINLISGLNIEKPNVPLISNVTSIPTQDIEEIRKNLINQITGRVRWRESILFMKKSGIQIIYEIGPGRVLCNLIKRIVDDVEQENISKVEDLFKLGN